MSRLDPQKLHVRLEAGLAPAGPLVPRRYTLTHSDATGDLFLTIGRDYDQAQVSGWYTRLMRDEVLAEWLTEDAGPVLHVHCHVSGGLALGPAGLRNAIFRKELPLALEAICYGDREFLAPQPELRQAAIQVHFHLAGRRYDRVEGWGTAADYLR